MVMNATADATTKKAIWRRPRSRRLRIPAAISSGVPVIRESCGSSAAATDIPKRLIGRKLTICAYDSADTAAVPRSVARRLSMYPLS